MDRLPHDIDIHTHQGPLRKDAVLCVDPTETEVLPDGDGFISIGVHPWNADKADQAVWQRLEKWLEDKRVVAVGETGLDRLRGPELTVQEDVFRRQARLAGLHRLPVVVHCVRCTDRLLQIRHDFSGQWIYHGFRGKPELARQLLDAGIDLSYGDKYNAASYALTPAERRYRESD